MLHPINQADLHQHEQQSHEQTPPPTPTIIRQQNYMTLKSTATNVVTRFTSFLRYYYESSRRLFVFTILTYVVDFLLFFILNFYLFTNMRYLFFDKIIVSSTTAATIQTATTLFTPNITTTAATELVSSLANQTTTTTTTGTSGILNITAGLRMLRNDLVNNTTDISTPLAPFKSELKQSYLTLQIITILIFFLYFILNSLLKLLFKYHKYELKVYKNSINSFIDDDDEEDDEDDEDDDEDEDDGDEVDNQINAYDHGVGGDIERGGASHKKSSTKKHKKTYSVSASISSNTTNSSKTTKTQIYIKFLIKHLIFKDSSIILNFYSGYQFCQNTFLNFNTIITILILIITFFKILICYLNEYYKFKTAATTTTAPPVTQPQLSVTTIKPIRTASKKADKKFNLINLNNITLYLGFCAALFHLFTIHITFQIIFIFLQLLLIIILLRFKTYLYSLLSLFLYILCMYKYISTISHIFRLNIVIFISYLFLLYINIIINNYFKLYCLTRLERWNRKFLCKNNLKRKFYVLLTFFCNFVFIIICIVIMYKNNIDNHHRGGSGGGGADAMAKSGGNGSILAKRESMYDEPGQQKTSRLYYYLNMFLLIPLFIIVSFIWIIFQFANTINLWFLMNKITECYQIASDTFIRNRKDGGGSNVKRALLRNTSIKFGSSSSNTSPENTFDNKAGVNGGAVGGGGSGGAGDGLPNAKSSISRSSRNLLRRVSNYLMETNKNEKKFRNIPLNRIMSFKGIRYISSISYRICFICTIQTLLLLIFIFYTQSAFVISLYLFIFNINLLWLNLLDCLSSIISGTCISYSLVVPIGEDGQDQAHQQDQPTSKQQNSNSIKVNYFLPFNYQKEIGQRCTYLLSKICEFLQFYLIENFGCDYASTGLNRDSLESKLRAFFAKRTLDGPKYNTYLLYYCGPTNEKNSSFQLQDGALYSIESIINVWKEIHCKTSVAVPISVKNKNYNGTLTTTDSDTDDNTSQNILAMANTTLNAINVTTNNIINSRLILFIDTKHTDLMLDYVKNIQQKNLYIALQTVKYEKKLNIGRFTIDWIRYNCRQNQQQHSMYDNSGGSGGDDDSSSVSDSDTVFNSNNAKKKSNHHYMKITNDEELQAESVNSPGSTSNSMSRRHSPHAKIKSSNSYKSKCAFSKHWNSYTFESNVNKMDAIEEINQYWSLYYPKIFRPLLKIINCPLFYHNFKFNFLNNFLCYYKSLKHFFLPQQTKEYDTGHGFKLIAS